MHHDHASPDQGLPLTSKAVAVLALLLLAANLLLGWVLAGQSREALRRQLDQRMLDCAVTAAEVVVEYEVLVSEELIVLTEKKY